jgi:3'(2'), 5'-bisphosphate nucleotidase
MQIHSFTTEYEVARRLAFDAGETILRQLEDGIEPVAGSTACAAFAAIHQGVQREFPNDATLTEATCACEERLGNDRVWIIDPFEEVSESGMRPREFVIAIGLTVASTPVIAVVYSPGRHVLYGAAWGAGAWVEEAGATRPLRARPLEVGSYRLISPRPAPEPILTSIRQELAAHEILQSGSTSVPCAMIADGAADLYIHPAPWLKDWQCCAPDLILREAGGTVTDCYGEPLTYNRKMPVQRKGFIGCAPGLLDTVLATVTPRFASIHAPRADPASRAPELPLSAF